MSQTIQVRRGLRANLPILISGELGFCLDTKETFVGDGIANYPIGRPLTGPEIVALINACGDIIDDNNLSANVADALTKRHVHGNLAVLNAIEVAFTAALNTKLSGIAEGANLYIHPTAHLPSIIVQDANNRFVTDTEKALWGGKAPGGYGLGEACKAVAGDWNDHQLTGFYMGLNLINQPPETNGSSSWWYVLVMTHNLSPGWMLQTATDFYNKATYRRAKLGGAWSEWVLIWDSSNFDPASKVNVISGKALSTNDFDNTYKLKLDGISEGANNYSHPSTHPPSIIAQDPSNRFVTDIEKTNWGAKETPTGAQFKADAALISANNYADTKVAAIVDSSPSTLDTLNELAAALGDDPNFATTMTNLISSKAPGGYGLGVVDLSVLAVGDCDLAVATGFYYATGSLNSPSADGHLLVMSYSAEWKQQMFWEYANKGETGNPGRIFKRHKYGGVWQAWYQIALVTDIPASLPANGGNADTVDGLHSYNIVQKSPSASGVQKLYRSEDINSYYVHHTWTGYGWRIKADNDHNDEQSGIHKVIVDIAYSANDSEKLGGQEPNFYETTSGSQAKTDAVLVIANTYTDSKIASLPTTLPANGGNADTVDSLDSSAFARSSTAGHLTSTALNNNTALASGLYSNTGDGILNNDGSVYRAGWWHVIHSHHSDNNGYDAQIAMPLSSEDNVYYRHAVGGTWGSWKLLWDSSNFDPASKVGVVAGKSLSTNDFDNTYKLKLDGISEGANNYSHPSTHPPSIIAQDPSNRFVPDSKIIEWDAKETPSGAQAKADAVLVSANNYSNIQITNIIDSSPATLDTLNKLAAALGDDPNFATNILNLIAGLLPLVGGTLSGLLVGRGSSGPIAEASQGSPSFEVKGVTSDPTSAAYVTFHRPGYYAVRFGLDVDNQLKVGGWSMGAVAYVVWTSGNFDPANKASSTHTHTGAQIEAPRADITKDIGTARELRWNHYGSSHTIFDASAGITPTGAAKNNTNSDVAWGPTYPTLMGYNGTSTYGVRVDTARVSESCAGNAASATTAAACSGNSITASSTPRLSSLGNYVKPFTALPATYDNGVTNSFVGTEVGFPSYGSVLTVKSYSDGGGGVLQLYAPYGSNWGGSRLRYRLGNYDDGENWTPLQTLANMSDIPASLPANGGNADTLDSLDSSAFARSSTVGHLTSTALNNNITLASGIYTNTGDGILNNDGSVFKSGWWHVVHSHHSDNNGFDAQIAIPLSSEDNMYYRHAVGGTWRAWKLVWDSGNFDPNSKANASHTHTKSQITDLPTSVNIVSSPTEPVINAGDWWYKEV